MTDEKTALPIQGLEWRLISQSCEELRRGINNDSRFIRSTPNANESCLSLVQSANCFNFPGCHSYRAGRMRPSIWPQWLEKRRRAQNDAQLTSVQS